jgi:cation:H+ antiporter
VSGPALLITFVVAAAATWFAGTYLSRATDVIDNRFGLGEALGGVVLLAIAGSLPEIAITVSAVLAGNIGIAAGNLIGGIAIQTLVLVLCDRTVKGDRPLSYLVGSLVPVLEGLLVVVVVAVMLLGTMLPESAAIGPVSPASLGMVVVWIAGIAILDRVRRREPWQVTMEGSHTGHRTRRARLASSVDPMTRMSSRSVIALFVGTSAVILVAGVALQASGSGLADLAGINGVVFGATFLAAATALPEVSTGLEAVRIGDNQLAMGDIFGGNAFQLTIFLLADLLAGQPLLPQAGVENAWLGTLGIVMTSVYVATILTRPRRRFAGFGIDSIVVTIAFALGIAGLAIIVGS